MQVEGYERSAHEMESLNSTTRRDTNNNSNPQTNSNRNNKGRSQNGPNNLKKTPKEMYGPICPNLNCRTRSHDMASHLKVCKREKSTSSNIVKVITLNVKLAVVKVCDPTDYLPILPMAISPSPDSKEKVQVQAFADSGSEKLLIRKAFADNLVDNHGFTEEESQTFRVNGVDSSGRGVLCDRQLNMYFHVPGALILLKALVVPGLPEEIIGGRAWKRALALSISSGTKPEDNFIHSEKYSIRHQLRTDKEHKNSVKSATDSFVCVISEESRNAKIEPVKSMFSTLTKNDMEEIFRLWTPPTFEK